jgi:septal ring factor EnvC (AmiA/AmiB activator)
MLFRYMDTHASLTEVLHTRNALAVSQDHNTAQMTQVHRDLAKLQRRLATQDARQASTETRLLNKNTAIGVLQETLGSDINSIKDTLSKIEERLSSITHILQAPQRASDIGHDFVDLSRTPDCAPP